MKRQRRNKPKSVQASTCRSKKINFGTPRKGRRLELRNEKSSYAPPEDWYEPIDEDQRNGYRVIAKYPGDGFVHVVEAAEVIDRLADLPSFMTESLDVVQLSQMTRKKLRLPCYGMQWGTALYLYPIEDSLIEIYDRPPIPQLLVETKMFGGKWDTSETGVWKLIWTEAKIKDFYLNNILIHELGHLLDERNRSYQDRERYAEWFAIEYGYLPSRPPVKKKRIKRRHHSH